MAERDELVSAASVRVSRRQTRLELPPGYDATGPSEDFQSVSGSPGDPSDALLRPNSNLARGYTVLPMDASDDYEGFLERGNGMDRS